MSVSNVSQQKQQKNHEAALELATRHLKQTQKMLLDEDWCLEVVDKLQKVPKRADKGREMMREVSMRLDHVDYLAGQSHAHSQTLVCTYMHIHTRVYTIHYIVHTIHTHAHKWYVHAYTH